MICFIIKYNRHQEKSMIKAKEIVLFTQPDEEGETEQQNEASSPMAASSVTNGVKQLEVFANQVVMTDEDQPVDEDEEEERAVADFVSEIELHNGKVKVRRETTINNEGCEVQHNHGSNSRYRGQRKQRHSNKKAAIGDGEDGDALDDNNKHQQNNDEDVDDGDEEASQQNSIDDVSDDEDEDETDQQRSSNLKIKDRAAYQYDYDDRIKADPAKSVAMSSTNYNHQQSSTTDSVTNRDISSSSNKESKLHNNQQPAHVTNSGYNGNQIQSNNNEDYEETDSVIAQKSQSKYNLKSHHNNRKQRGSENNNRQSTSATKKTALKNSQDSTEPPIFRGEQTITGACSQIQKPEVSAPAASIVSRRAEPQLIKESIVKSHFQRFMAHVETREINKASDWESSPTNNNNKDTMRSNGSPSVNSNIDKDNEDPNGAGGAFNQVDHFEPSELREKFEGWSLYKKNRISFVPVRRYQLLVDQDYKRNKVTVCAHLQHIYNSYCVKRGKATTQMSNYFDINKWSDKIQSNHNQAASSSANQTNNYATGGGDSPKKDLKRTETITNITRDDATVVLKENYLLSKTNSTAHIPENSRTKNTKRTYANFDKDLAIRMFGYRVIYQQPEEDCSDDTNTDNKEAPQIITQAQKPIQRFVNDIMGELSQNYQQIHRFGTKQRILIPMPDDSDDEEFYERNGNKVNMSMNQQHKMQQSPTKSCDSSYTSPKASESQQSPINFKLASRNDNDKLVGELVVLKTRNGQRQTFLKRIRNLLWHYLPPERQTSAKDNKRANNSNVNKSPSIYGPQNFSTSSPARNSVSPKKAVGYNPNINQKLVTPQTQYLNIKNMQIVRYALPKQGQQLSSYKFSSGYGPGAAGNQNFNNYRRQNSSQRKGNRSLRGDSEKGARQSQDNKVDQNFIVNDGQKGFSQQDNEVAKITKPEADNSQQNVVTLKDPKLIKSFGSNVVHVNVSCGQSESNAKNRAGGGGKQSQNASEKTPKVKEEEEEEGTETFIIQLSEEQTRQLSKGNLKLNGVPIPKDLSNLSYDQIMALLDSVNLPAKSSNKASADRKKDNSSKAMAKQGQQQPILKDQVKESGSQQNSKQAQQSLRQSITQQQQQQQQHGKQQAQKNNYLTQQQHQNLHQHQQQRAFVNQNGNSNKPSSNNQMVSHTQNNFSTNLNSNNNNTNNNELCRQQQQQYKTSQFVHQDSLVSSPIEQLALGKNVNTRQNSHYFNQTGAPQKPTRLESVSRRAWTNGQQQSIQYGKSPSADKKNGLINTNQHHLYQQQQRLIQNPKAPSDGLGAQLTRNSAPNAAVTANSAVINSNGMGNSEWLMLDMLSKQQMQLKSAQKNIFQQNYNLNTNSMVNNLEQARKMHASTVLQQQNKLPLTSAAAVIACDATKQSYKHQNATNGVKAFPGSQIPTSGSIASSVDKSLANHHKDPFALVTPQQRSTKNSSETDQKQKAEISKSQLYHHSFNGASTKTNSKTLAGKNLSTGDPLVGGTQTSPRASHTRNLIGNIIVDTNNTPAATSSQQMISTLPQAGANIFIGNNSNENSKKGRSQMANMRMGGGVISNKVSPAAASSSIPQQMVSPQQQQQQQQLMQQNPQQQNQNVKSSISRWNSNQRFAGVNNDAKKSSAGFFQNGASAVAAQNTTNSLHQPSARMSQNFDINSYQQQAAKSQKKSQSQPSQKQRNFVDQNTIPSGSGATPIANGLNNKKDSKVFVQHENQLLSSHFNNKTMTPSQQNNAQAQQQLISKAMYQAQHKQNGLQQAQQAQAQSDQSSKLNEFSQSGVLNRFYSNMSTNKKQGTTVNGGSFSEQYPARQGGQKYNTNTNIQRQQVFENLQKKHDGVSSSTPNAASQANIPGGGSINQRVNAGKLQHPSQLTGATTKKNELHHQLQQKQQQQSRKALMQQNNHNPQERGVSGLHFHHNYQSRDRGLLADPSSDIATGTIGSNPMQKMRINQHSLNNNHIGVSNDLNPQQQQVKLKTRKIESALAQSAINAIQNQNTSYHIIPQASNTTSISNQGKSPTTNGKSPFLQFEQKAYSQPQNQIIQQTTYHNNTIIAANQSSSVNGYPAATSNFIPFGGSPARPIHPVNMSSTKTSTTSQSGVGCQPISLIKATTAGAATTQQTQQQPISKTNHPSSLLGGVVAKRSINHSNINSNNC